MLSQYDIGFRTLKVVKSQAIADMLAQFPGKEECSLSEEIPGEVAVAELPGKKWTITFDSLGSLEADVKLREQDQPLCYPSCQEGLMKECFYGM